MISSFHSSEKFSSQQDEATSTKQTQQDPRDQGIIGPSRMQDTAPSSLPSEKLKGAGYSTDHQKVPAWRKETLPLTQRRTGQPLQSDPAQAPVHALVKGRPGPWRVERIKERIGFLFSCKKHLPPGYEHYCMCVVQLASITGS